MIAKLWGIVDSIYGEYVILNVNGVGYRVFCSSRVLAFLQEKIKQNTELLISTIVKEDSITLFGFANEREKEWFEILCKVNGIGNKMALKIMSALAIEEIVSAIASEDTKAFCRAPGVGGKLATRIISELKGSISTLDITIETVSNIVGKKASLKDNGILNDALSALENLGYSKSISYNILSNIIKEREDISLESLITEALKRINNF